MSEQRPESLPENDVVSLLLQQHQMIRALCDEVTAATAASRQEPFQRLLRLMAVHEAVEEEIVHPFVRRRVQGATAMVEDRLQEERAAKEMLVQLDSMGPTAAGFMPLFDQFRTAVIAHSEKEESSEFAGLREQTRPAERRAMTAAAKVAAALAPTHPHPGVESATGNLLVGTPLAMIDRARDLIRNALGPKGASSAQSGNGDTPAASGTKNKDIIRRLTEAFDAADETTIRALLTTDFVAHGLPPGVSEDADGWVRVAVQVKAAMPDHHMVIDDMVAEDDKVTLRFTDRGTHTGDLFGAPPSNRAVTVTGIEIYRLSGGQVAEWWGEVNMSDLFGPPVPGAAAAGAEPGQT
jgi:predicted ester cyclase/hemerythrin superfamily protein